MNNYYEITMYVSVYVLMSALMLGFLISHLKGIKSNTR